MAFRLVVSDMRIFLLLSVTICLFRYTVYCSAPPDRDNEITTSTNAQRKAYVRNRTDAETARDFGLPLLEQVNHYSLKDLLSFRNPQLRKKPGDYFLRLFSHHQDIQKISEKTKKMTPEEMAEAWTSWRQKQRDIDNDSTFLSKLTRSLNRHFEKNLKLDQSTRELIDGHWTNHVTKLRHKRKKDAINIKRQDPNYDLNWTIMQQKWKQIYYSRVHEKQANDFNELTIEQILARDGLDPYQMTPVEIEEASRCLCLNEASFNRKTKELITYLQDKKGCNNIVLKAIRGRRTKALQNLRRLESHHRLRHERIRNGRTASTHRLQQARKNHIEPKETTELAALLAQSHWWISL